MIVEGAIAWVLVGLIAGSLATQFMPGRGYGIAGDIGIGVVGALVGGFSMSLLGFQSQAGLLTSITTAFVGAVALASFARARPGRSPA